MLPHSQGHFILGFKTGVWTIRPLLAAALAAACFTTLYAAMLTTALFVRSTALSAAVGGIVFVAGIVAGYRSTIAPMFEEGPSRAIFNAVTLPLPRIGALGKTCFELAGSRPIDSGALASLLLGFFVFSAATLAIGAWRFEQRDF